MSGTAEELQEYLENARPSETKKFQQWEAGPTELSGARQPHLKTTVEVRGITRGRGGMIVGFRVEFPDGKRFHSSDLHILRQQAEEYARERAGWTFEDVLEIQVEDGYRTSREEREHDAGAETLGIRYCKYRKVVGKDIYYDDSWGRCHPRGTIIKWTAERQAALELALDRLNEIRVGLGKLLGEKQAAKTLDAAMLGRLLQAPGENKDGAAAGSVG